MVTLTEAAILVHGVLDADTSLRASHMLKSANRIFNHPQRPALRNNPALTIEVRTDGKGERGTVNFFVRLRLYLDDFGEDTADVTRAGAIQARLEELLDGKQLTNANGVVCRGCFSDFDSGPHQDQEFPREAAWVFDYNLKGCEKV